MSEPAPRAVEPDADVTRRYITPAWVPRPRRGQQAIPTQSTAADQDREQDREQAPGSGALDAPPSGERLQVLQHARWTGPQGARRVVGAFLVSTLGLAAAAGVWAAQAQSTTSIAAIGVCLGAAACLWALLALTPPTVVELDGTKLTVHGNRTVDTFDLTDPFTFVDARGEAGTSSWSLMLGRSDGTGVVVGWREADSVALMPVITHARQYAERGRKERDQRFNR